MTGNKNVRPGFNVDIGRICTPQMGSVILLDDKHKLFTVIHLQTVYKLLKLLEPKQDQDWKATVKAVR